MVAETLSSSGELLDRPTSTPRIWSSRSSRCYEKLATHYGIPGVRGSQIRRVELANAHPCGRFSRRVSLLKITANGTTTSPVPRGAFATARLLGEEPDPPPPNVPAIEPDVRGAKTIREQLDKHRADATCASCHRKMDPPGFALESIRRDRRLAGSVSIDWRRRPLRFDRSLYRHQFQAGAAPSERARASCRTRAIFKGYRSVAAAFGVGSTATAEKYRASVGHLFSAGRDIGFAGTRRTRSVGTRASERGRRHPHADS